MEGAQTSPVTVGESTVSLDELSVQPDFPYDDSEQSVDDPGSDSSIQTVLPQGSE